MQMHPYAYSIPMLMSKLGEIRVLSKCLNLEFYQAMFSLIYAHTWNTVLYFVPSTAILAEVLKFVEITNNTVAKDGGDKAILKLYGDFPFEICRL